MKHTKGPWKRAGRFATHILTGDGRMMVADAPHPIGMKEEEGFANADLIAAAPELLEALEACRDAIQRLAKESPDGVPMWASAAQDSAKAAIAKAHGF